VVNGHIIHKRKKFVSKDDFKVQPKRDLLIENISIDKRDSILNFISRLDRLGSPSATWDTFLSPIEEEKQWDQNIQSIEF